MIKFDDISSSSFYTYRDTMLNLTTDFGSWHSTYYAIYYI
jgi:ACT domain-containing protein